MSATTLGFITVNSAFMGFIMFSVACIVSGMMFAGIDNTPPDKVAGTVITIQKWTGIGLLFATFFFFLAPPQGLDRAIAFWFGTLLGFFGLLWLILSDTLAKGTDFKPFGIFLLFTAVICTTYAVNTVKYLDGWGNLFGTEFWGSGGYAQGMLGDFFVLITMAAVACYSAFIGIRYKAALLKYVGYLFIIIGAWGTYMCVRYISELFYAFKGVGA